MQVQELINQLPVAWCGIDDVKLDPNNPNKMSHKQMEGFRDVMRKWGDGGPVRVDANMIMIDGEHRWKILKSDGALRLQYIQHPNVKTAAERAILRQFYNKISGSHEKYLDDLEFKRMYEAGMLQEFSVGIAEDLDIFQRRLKAEFDIQFGGVETMNVVSLPKKTNIVRGQVFKLGRHRLMCGDCRIQSDVSDLLQEAHIDNLQTDPPYGVEIANKNRMLNEQDGGHRIQDAMVGDNIKDLRKYIADAFRLIPWAETNTFYIWMAGNHMLDVLTALDDCKMKYSQELVWVKNNHAMSRLDHKQKHEICLYGWFGRHIWKGGMAVSVYKHDKPLANELHPTQKPLELIEEFIRESTKENALVYDPFSGSGTTLIACEKTKRTAFCMEIDPIYVQATLTRFEKYTGEKAELEPSNL